MKYLFLFFICFSSVFLESAIPEAIYLTWKRDPTTTMTFQWITKSSDTNNTVEIYSEATDSWMKVEGSAKPLPQNEPYLVHAAEATKLKPKTTYRFRLKTNPGEELFFRTMPADLTDSITFVAGGDTNQMGTSAFEATCCESAAHEPYFALFGGDLAYAAPNKKDEPENAARWISWLASYSKTMITPTGHLIPLLVTIGNHDVKGHYAGTPADAPFYFTLFSSMPGLPGYNVLRFGNYLSIYLLDTNHCNSIKGEQTDWLRAQLAKERDTLHKIAIYHVPAYPSVRDFKGNESAAVRRYWSPLFEKYRLHVALENNDHAYKRTWPLINDQAHPRGVLYIGDGSWGTKPRTPKKAKHTSYLAKTAGVRQFLKIDLSAEMREFTSLTPEGSMVDHYIQFTQ